MRGEKETGTPRSNSSVKLMIFGDKTDVTFSFRLVDLLFGVWIYEHRLRRAGVGINKAAFRRA